MNSRQKVTEIVSQILGLGPNLLPENARMGEPAEWDSLAQIEILDALDVHFADISSRHPSILDAKSLQELVSIVELVSDSESDTT